MQEKQKGTRFGGIRHITKPQYVDEITKAGEGIWVLVLLVEEGHKECEYLLRIMNEVADRNPHLKIVSIKSTDAINNFPKEQLPTCLVYQSGSMSRTVNGIKAWAPGPGQNPTVESVEESLRKQGPLRGERAGDDSDDEDEEEDDRETRTAGVQRQVGRSKFSLM